MSDPVPTDEDGWTEVVDGVVGRVDLVGRGANGAPFLLMKGAGAGLMSPEAVRDLIAKATPEERTMTATTFTGSPADVMRAIHNAPNGETMSDVVTKADVVEPDEALPDADEVASDAQPAAGDPDDPGSPAWEAVDAERARQALQLTLALQRLVAQSAAREAQEVAVGDDCDPSDVWTLEDVGFAIDAIIAGLAPFAVTEQAEADEGMADDTLVKAGRVLSSANEAKIRGAADALQAVLGSLPAPVDEAAEVAKESENDMAKMAPITVPVTAEVTVQKAKGDAQVAVYTADGKLVGTVDPGDVSPIADAAAPAAGDDTVEAETAPEVQPDATDAPTPAEAAPAPEAPPVAVPPAPVAKEAPPETPEPTPDELMKSSFLEAIKEALAPLEDRLEKMEAQPMPGGPMMNGVLPGADPIAQRGQSDHEGSPLRKAYEDEKNPVRKQELQMELSAFLVKNAPRLGG